MVSTTTTPPTLLSTRTDSELEKASIHDEKPHSLEDRSEGKVNYSSEEENLTRALSSRQISMIAIVRSFEFSLSYP